MEIRRLKPCEHGRTRALYEEVFPEDDAAFVDYYYTWKTRDNVIFVAEDGDGIHAMVHLNPFCVRYFGRDVQMHYIVAVATQPEYRHRGLMRRLLALAEQELRDAGEPFTFLMPASEAIYRPFGYRFFAWQRRGILRGTEDDGERLADDESGRLAYNDGRRPADGNSEHLVNDGDMHSAAGAEADQRVSDCTNAAGIICRPLQQHEYDAAADFANAVLDSEYDMYVLRDSAYYERLCAEQRCQGGEVMAIHRSMEQDGDEAARILQEGNGDGRFAALQDGSMMKEGSALSGKEKSRMIGLFRTALDGDEGRLSLYEVILCQEYFAEAERALRAFAAPYGCVAVEGCQDRLALEQAAEVPLMMGKALSQAAGVPLMMGKIPDQTEDAECLPGKISEQIDNPGQRSIFLHEVV